MNQQPDLDLLWKVSITGLSLTSALFFSAILFWQSAFNGLSWLISGLGTAALMSLAVFNVVELFFPKR